MLKKKKADFNCIHKNKKKDLATVESKGYTQHLLPKLEEELQDQELPCHRQIERSVVDREASVFAKTSKVSYLFCSMAKS